MSLIRKIAAIGIAMFFSGTIAVGKDYEQRKADGHVLHILNLSAKDYDLQLVKAHDQVFGRETIESMALRTSADIAINAGFFEIGNNHDGMPSGTLIIDGKIFGFNGHKNGCLVKKDAELTIRAVHHPLVIEIGGKSLSIHKVNKFPEKNDCVLYTSLWGRNTLTPRAGRKEVVFDEHHNLVEILDHGASAIPKNGYVISLPKSHPLDVKKIPAGYKLNMEKLLPLSMPDYSVVTGIPILIEDGKIVGEVLNSKASFYTTPHARTALGLKKNGDVVIVVVEHHYMKPLTEITLGEVKDIITNNKLKLLAKYRKSPADLSMKELKDIVKHEFTTKGAASGLTLPELAQLLLDLGCESAINFDGGGSSSLWMNGKVVNASFGDVDESMGQLTVRPIADAIVFQKKG